VPLTSKREQYLALMRQGMSNAGASRAAGVNRKTGHRWRYGRVVTTRTGESRTYAAITGPAHPVSARYLSEAERISIADGLIRGSSIRAIAGELGRAPSTISREIRRNRDAGSVAYHPYRGGHRAARRRVRRRPRKLAHNPELRTAVTDRLEGRWSPEQVSRMLPGLFPGRPEMQVAPETIYQALYATGPERLVREGVRRLRSGRVHRKRRRRSGERAGRFVAPMVMIDQRPADVAGRLVAGHWEGDLITGSANRSAIETLVERTTRYVLLRHLPDGHGAERVRDALVDP
jgi:IS30 family transposase